MTTTVLIDGDIFCYQAAAAHEVEIQWDEFQWYLGANAEDAQHQLQDSIDEIAEKLQADHIVVALSDRKNWRKGLSPLYKAHRKTRKPVIYPVMRDYCYDAWEVIVKPWLEADDVLGILSTNPKLYPGDKIICSIDKDFQGIPGKLLNSRKAHKAQIDNQRVQWVDFVQHITEADADYFHMYQTLTGDASDGYKGCPGVGPVKADKLLEPCFGDDSTFNNRRAWEIVLSAFKTAKQGPEEALLNARLARICRTQDYNYTKKEVKLWEPPSA